MLKAMYCTLVAGLLLVPGSLPAQTSIASEYQVKAAFLYNFGKFFDWPSTVMSGNAQPFTICVLGGDAVTNELRPLVSGKSLGAHPVQVRQVHGVEEGRSCQILFITAAAAPQAMRSLGSLAESSVLTVGEVPGFCNQQGILNFRMEADHIRFEINLKAAERAHLHPSSKLLRLARIVGGPDQNGGGP
jgi:YfiR/HmsC-like